MFLILVPPFVEPSSVERSQMSYIREYYQNKWEEECSKCSPTIIKKDGSFVPMSKRQWHKLIINKYKQLQDLKQTY